MSEPFIAEIRIWATIFAPRGWAFCQGQELPIAQNVALFSLLGTTYGGDGRTTFSLPNLAARFPLHPGSGPGLSRRTLGETGGQAMVAMTEGQTPAHNHTAQASQVPGETGTPSGSVALAPGVELLATDPVTKEELTEPRNLYGPDPGASDRVDMADAALATTGAGQPHENRHPWLALNFTIALVGVYPSPS